MVSEETAQVKVRKAVWTTLAILILPIFVCSGSWMVMEVGMMIVTGKGLKAETTPLCDAGNAGRLSKVQKLLDDGEDPNEGDEHGYTPLLCALLQGHLDVAEALYEAGADVNAEDRRAVSILDRLQSTDPSLQSYEDQQRRGAAIAWLKRKIEQSKALSAPASQ